MKCPACGKGTVVFKCNQCGDIRCALGNCPGTVGNQKGLAQKGLTCKACKKGRYEKM
jgi:hypothetical protein